MFNSNSFFFQLSKMTSGVTEIFGDMKSKFKAKERNLALMCITIITVFVIFHSLYSIYYILKKLHMLNHFGTQYIHSTARFFAIINSSTNIIIYLVFDEKFKKTFISMFTRLSFETEDPTSVMERTPNILRKNDNGHH